MIFGSVCSGIEAASVAWVPLGWRAAWLAEVAPFPSAVLAQRWPEVPNHGDFTQIRDAAAIDLLVGGTPCQSFSIAGLRGGMDDARGNLALEFLRLAARARPRWVVWENVPGVLSSNGGRDFGAILGGLAELGYGWAYRILDAQFFGLAQRRKRVFVVGYLGDWRRAAAVLLERHCLQGNPPPGREARTRVAGTLESSAGNGRGWRVGTDEAASEHIVAHALTATKTATGRLDPNGETLLAVDLRNVSAGDISPTLEAAQAKGNKGVGVIAFHATQDPISGNVSPALSGNATIGVFDEAQITSATNRSTLSPTLGRASRMHAVTAFSSKDHGADATADLSPTLRSGNHHHSHANGGVAPAIAYHAGVRRLMPVEAERLQGFPDGYTAITYRGKPSADGPRMQALGNSMAVPCMRWIGRRIAFVDAIKANSEAAA